MRYDKKIKTENFPKTYFFSTKNIFRKILKKSTFSKKSLFQKKRKFRKSQFLKFSIFQIFFEKVTFWIFRFFEIFRKLFFNRKNENFQFFLVFMFLSYLMCNLSEWHRGTPPVPPVGAVNVPPKIWKNMIFRVFLWFCVGFSMIYDANTSHQPMDFNEIHDFQARLSRK